MRPGEFHGTLPGFETTDADAWPAAVKAAPPFPSHSADATRNVRPAKMGPDPSLRGIQVPKSWKPSPLTAVEKEWLGETIETPGGRTGQVWSASNRTSYLWAVVPNDTTGVNEPLEVLASSLRKV